jgi:hypothetical protein
MRYAGSLITLFTDLVEQATKAQMRGWWSTPRLGRFTPRVGDLVPTVQNSGWGRCEWVRKISPPPGFDTRTVQPVASRYTDCAIPARFSQFFKSLETRNSFRLQDNNFNPDRANMKYTHFEVSHPRCVCSIQIVQCINPYPANVENMVSS